MNNHFLPDFSSQTRRSAILRLLLIVLAGLLFTPVTRAAEVTEKNQDLPAYEFPTGLPWLNVSRPLTLKALRGKVVILDFWTYGCINCIHVLDDLRRLEEKYRPYLVVIGVHSPKFDREKNIGALRNIVVRYDIEHPVVNDVEFRIGRYFGMRAWPTQVVLDPLGEPLGKVTGEGNYEILDSVIGDLIEKHSDRLDPAPLPVSLEKRHLAKSLLAAPAKIAVSGNRVAISDTLHHRVILADHDGRILEIYGGPEKGDSGGTAAEVRFSSPRGLAFGAGGLFVADTGNHLIRYIDLARRKVKTVGGNGEPELPRMGEFDALETGLRSPWGLALKDDQLYIAMAGNHQIWKLDLTNGKIQDYAGSGREGLRDGSLPASRFSQPSGLSIQGDWLYVADAEDSAVRRIDMQRGQVKTLIGTGLFDFGDRDGPFTEALLQHPLGVAALGDDQVLVADTYNSKLKLLDLEKRRVTTLTGGDRQSAKEGDLQLNEPGGIALLDSRVLIADTNNHRILSYDLKKGTLKEWRLRSGSQE
jgi:thiol-disulfide isomerase/thioredoxin/DNA-binding beta-propeller fold protein YncE